MSKHQDYEGHEHLPLAYRNDEFLDSPEGRSLRILSEYLYPLGHFRKERVHDTVVFFGSARLMEMGPLGRYYNEARELAHRLGFSVDECLKATHCALFVERKTVSAQNE